MNPIVTIPNFLPLLTNGLGDAAEGRACAMSAVHWMEGGKGDNDMPECVHPALSRAFVSINDFHIWDDDAHRTRTLWPLIARAIGTAPTGSEHENHVLEVQLALFSALYCAKFLDRKYAGLHSHGVAIVQGWLDGKTTQSDCATVYLGIDQTTAELSYDDINYHLLAALESAAMAASDASVSKNFCRSSIVKTYAAIYLNETDVYLNRTDHPGGNNTLDYVDFLITLLDEHARLTAHSPLPVDLRGLEVLVPTIAV